MLQGVDFDVHPGQVTALVGDNGAGKSTLIKGIAGIHAFDTGEYLFDGKPVHVAQPHATPTRSGIEVVYQDLALCDNLDVVHNMFLGRELTKLGLLDEAAMETQATRDPRRSLRAHAAVGPHAASPACPVASARPWPSPAPCCGTPRSSILDEPTAALGVAQTEQVLALVRRLADHGLGVVLISHNLNDVFQVADDIAVLYLGEMVAQVDAKDVTNNQVVELITTGQASGRASSPTPTNGADAMSATTEDAMSTRPSPPRRAATPAAPTSSAAVRDSCPRLRHQGPRRRRRRAARRRRAGRAGRSSSPSCGLDSSPTPSTSPT